MMLGKELGHKKLEAHQLAVLSSPKKKQNLAVKFFNINST
jgi:hypothetical protein